jgi:arabinogalactan oligomer / maltooligosaccharide transport system substrate-binding protein
VIPQRKAGTLARVIRDLLAGACLLAACACGARDGEGATASPSHGLRLLHTFGAGETDLLAGALAGWTEAERIPVSTSLVPFARGQTVIGALLRAGTDCPDLIRIDATWLPALARAGLLEPASPAIAARDWLPEARELASDGQTLWAAPQAVDGLIVVEASAGASASPPAHSLDELIAMASQAQAAGRARWGLGLRVDGYWVVPFLRAVGADVADGAAGSLGIDRPGAALALTRFAALFGTVAAPPPAPGQEAADEARRFRAGEIAYLVTGPWALADAGELDRLRVGPMPGAPRGGQLLVVPRCAGDRADAWRLALHLTDPEVQWAWARALGTVPTTRTALDGSPRVVREAYAALGGARPLPRDPVTALLFDDLTPAVAAVVAGDATAPEALAGVERAWRRLLARGPAR